MPGTPGLPAGCGKVIGLYLAVLATYLMVLLPPEIFLALAVEDGIIETVGAIAFLLASLLFFAAYRYSSGIRDHSGSVQTRRNLFYFLLGLLFLVCFGEEISWGQRVFDWQTPDWLEAKNIQGETNLHNIDVFHSRNRDGTPKTGLALLLNMNRLFSLFWLTFCVIIPVAYRFSGPVRKWADRTGLPIVPLWIGGLFVAHAVVFQWVFTLLSQTDAGLAYRVNELKEANYAIIFLVLAGWELRRTFRLRSQKPAQAP